MLIISKYIFPKHMDHCCVFQSISRVRVVATPWTTECQASLSSLSLRVCSNSCPLSQWCHPTISSSVVPFSPWPQSFPASGSFLMSWLFASSGQSIATSAPVLPMNINGPLENQKMNHSKGKETLPMRKKWLTLKQHFSEHHLQNTSSTGYWVLLSKSFTAISFEKWRIWYNKLILSFLEWKLTFSSPVAIAEFSKFAGILSAAL